MQRVICELLVAFLVSKVGDGLERPVQLFRHNNFRAGQDPPLRFILLSGCIPLKYHFLMRNLLLQRG